MNILFKIVCVIVVFFMLHFSAFAQIEKMGGRYYYQEKSYKKLDMNLIFGQDTEAFQAYKSYKYREKYAWGFGLVSIVFSGLAMASYVEMQSSESNPGNILSFLASSFLASVSGITGIIFKVNGLKKFNQAVSIFNQNLSRNNRGSFGIQTCNLESASVFGMSYSF